MSLVTADVADRIRDFILAELLLGEAGALPADDASLLEGGAIDSTDVLELVTFLEREFAIQVPDEEVVPVNFDSVAGLAAYTLAKSAQRELR